MALARPALFDQDAQAVFLAEALSASGLFDKRPYALTTRRIVTRQAPVLPGRRMKKKLKIYNQAMDNAAKMLTSALSADGWALPLSTARILVDLRVLTLDNIKSALKRAKTPYPSELPGRVADLLSAYWEKPASQPVQDAVPLTVNIPPLKMTRRDDSIMLSTRRNLEVLHSHTTRSVLATLQYDNLNIGPLEAIRQFFGNVKRKSKHPLSQLAQACSAALAQAQATLLVDEAEKLLRQETTTRFDVLTALNRSGDLWARRFLEHLLVSARSATRDPAPPQAARPRTARIRVKPPRHTQIDAAERFCAFAEQEGVSLPYEAAA
jgi:hypothetical protein